MVLAEYETRCAKCVAKLAEEEQQAAARRPKKGEVLKLLPPGTQVSLTRQANGSWAGKLTADGMTVELAGMAGTGPQSIIVALARLWTASKSAGGSKLAG
jgi:hypothetical protein